jgi:hypothetical protein
MKQPHNDGVDAGERGWGERTLYITRKSKKQYSGTRLKTPPYSWKSCFK